MENASIVSKVLVIDDGDIDVLTEIKRFCQDNNIVALKTHSGNVMNLLRSNVDLGGILLSESYRDNPKGGHKLAKEIHTLRPELPIFCVEKKPPRWMIWMTARAACFVRPSPLKALTNSKTA